MILIKLDASLKEELECRWGAKQLADGQLEEHALMMCHCQLSPQLMTAGITKAARTEASAVLILQVSLCNT